MKLFTPFLSVVAMTAWVIMEGCSSAPKSPDMAGPIQDAIRKSGYKDVSVSQDREKGVVTLKGSVKMDAEKVEAESIAKSMAGGQVIGNEIAVLPPGAESTAKRVNSDLDDAIGKNLSAALIQTGMKDVVNYEVKNGVVTLSGSVISQTDRTNAEKTAAGVPNVQQVVNKLDVKNQKASSAKP